MTQLMKRNSEAKRVGYGLEFVKGGVVQVVTTTSAINLSGRAPQTAWRWQVIRNCWSTALG